MWLCLMPRPCAIAQRSSSLISCQLACSMCWSMAFRLCAMGVTLVRSRGEPYGDRVIVIETRKARLMPKTAPLILVLAPFILASSLQRAAQHPDIQVAAPEMRFDNGLWFDDSAFIRATVFVEDGRLRFAANRAEAGRAANRVIDLRGRYVVPPFCEAHNHNLGLDSEQNSQHINNYLRDGVFYINVLSDLPREAAAVWHTYNTPQSVDAQFANGGITGPGGHPIRLRELLLARGLYQGFTKESLRNHAYYVIDSDADLEATWPLILQYRPDFLKLILVHSEEYAKRRDDPAYFGDK